MTTSLLSLPAASLLVSAGASTGGGMTGGGEATWIERPGTWGLPADGTGSLSPSMGSLDRCC